MAVRIRARNFQSIEDAEIVVDGLTVLTGTNNAGKSAFIRAFFSVFTNPSVDGIIRVGALHTQVEVEFDDGNTLSWKKGKDKGKNVNQYTINGKVFDNVDRGAPEEALVYGVHPVECGKETLWPQIAMQQDNVSFVLNRPGSLIAEAVVADIEKVTILNKALSLAEKDRRAARAEIKIRLADLDDMEGKVSSFEEVLPILTEISQFGTEGVRSLLKDVTFVTSEVEALESLREGLHVFDGLPELGGGLDLSQAKRALVEIHEAAQLASVLHETTRKVKILEGVEHLQGSTPSFPSLEELEYLAGLIKRGQVLSKDLKSVEGEILELETQIGSLGHEDHDFLAQFGGTCPLCNSTLAQEE